MNTIEDNDFESQRQHVKANRIGRVDALEKLLYREDTTRGAAIELLDVSRELAFNTFLTEDDKCEILDDINDRLERFRVIKGI